MLEGLIDLRFKATVVMIKTGKQGSYFIGSVIDRQTSIGMEEAGVGVSAELGKYHTFVTDGLVSSSKIERRRLQPYRDRLLPSKALYANDGLLLYGSFKNLGRRE